MSFNRIQNIILLCFSLGIIACNSGDKKSESVSASGTSREKVSIEEIEEGIKAYIEKETSANDGFF